MAASCLPLGRILRSKSKQSAQFLHWLRLPATPHSSAMLTRLYIEALLVDEEQADQVWEAWDKADIDDQVAWLAWTIAASAAVGF